MGITDAWFKLMAANLLEGNEVVIIGKSSPKYIIEKLKEYGASNISCKPMLKSSPYKQTGWIFKIT